MLGYNSGNNIEKDNGVIREVWLLSECEKGKTIELKKKGIMLKKRLKNFRR